MGESRPGWMIVRDVARAMEIEGFDFADRAAVLSALADAAPDFKPEESGSGANPVFVGTGDGKVRVFADPAAPPPPGRLLAAPAAPDADWYKGLNMAGEIKALKVIRNRGK